jgi:hypothetical protein
MDLLEHTKVIDVIGRENIFTAQAGLGASLDAAQEAAEKWLATSKPEQAVEDAS